MSQETTTSGGMATSGFVITHYLRPADSALSWQQWTSAELSAADAVACINERAKDAATLGFADPAAEQAADPAQAASADAAQSPTVDGSAGSATFPAVGEYE